MTAPKAAPLVEIGRLTRPHGVRGEVRVHLHNAESETLDSVREVTLVRKGATLGVYAVTSLRHADKAVLLRLRGVEDRDRAEALRGSSVCVPRSALPALAPGEYYLGDLVGARVVGPSGDVGVVVSVNVHPSVDSVVIRTETGDLVEQALADPWILRVDTEAGVLELASLDGLV